MAINDRWYELQSFLGDPLQQQPVPATAVAFDHKEELVWAGLGSGRLSSFAAPDMQRYSSVQAHRGEILQVAPTRDGILSISEECLRLHSRGGVLQTSVVGESLTGLRCFATMQGNQVLLGGEDNVLCNVDLSTGQVVNEIDTSTGVAVMRGGRKLMCGGMDGTISVRDPRTGEAEHEFRAHPVGVTGLDIKGDLLATIGLTSRQGQVLVDRNVQLFDIRTYRLLGQISCPPGPSFVRFHPKFTATLVTLAENQLQFTDTQGGIAGQISFHQVECEGDVAMCCDCSSTGEMLAIGDSGGFVHQWVDREESVINAYPQYNCQLPDPPELIMDVEEDTYLCPETLIAPPPAPPGRKNVHLAPLSDWAQGAPVSLVGRLGIEPPQELTANMRQVDFVGYIPNPGWRRCDIPSILRPTRGRKVLHELRQKRGLPTQDQDQAQAPGQATTRHGDDLVPKHLARQEIKWNKLDEFDFKSYNTTRFAGLENAIPNSYCNSALQTLYFTKPLRVAMLNHICLKDACMSCELGFLFRMLDQACGWVCHASNFLRAFRQIPQASALGLYESGEPSLDNSQTRRIENFNRFLLERVHKELQGGANERSGKDAGREEKATPSIVDRLFGATQYNVTVCDKKHEVTKSIRFYQFDLVAKKDETGAPVSLPFSSVLHSSMVKTTQTRAWCDVCRSYQPITQKKFPADLPSILTLSCSSLVAENMHLLRANSATTGPTKPMKAIPEDGLTSPPKSPEQRAAMAQEMAEMSTPENRRDSVMQDVSWFPLKMSLRLDPKTQELTVREERKERHEIDMDQHTVLYELTSVVSHIDDVYDLDAGTVDEGHLIAHIKASSPGGCSTPGGRKVSITDHDWFAFNDFHVTPSSAREAVAFGNPWRTPCTMTYSRVDLNEEVPAEPLVNPHSDTALTVDDGISQQKKLVAKSFIPLEPWELPKEGELVAIDAEFVALSTEETELRTDQDGISVQTKPTRLGLARVSVVRGEGAREGEPMIDDYIFTPEPIADYLTRFSGLRPGDLDPGVSKHHVTTLKSAYCKLLRLIDRGVCFVGHGLRKDFRIINIWVPPDQIIDTVNLFHQPRQRKISLRFLAKHLLHIDIQRETHDSIEDAKTALALYRKYQELVEAGTFDDTLQELYKIGRATNWVVED